jgi:hypothetical protein
MIHPPYGVDGEYRGENDMEYLARTNLAALAASAKHCGFCAIINRSICEKKDEWIELWAEHTWADTCSTGEEILQVYEEQPWFDMFDDEIEGRKEIDEEKVLVVLSFPKNESLLSVLLQLPPWPPLLNAREQRHEYNSPPNRPLAKLEYMSKTGMSTNEYRSLSF